MDLESQDEWDIEYTDEFDAWYRELDEELKGQLIARIDVIAERGPSLGRPIVERITSSVYPNMKELRTGTVRVLFAFDPRQTAILLLGGDKAGSWNAWYEVSVPQADALYGEHLASLRKEGLL